MGPSAKPGILRVFARHKSTNSIPRSRVLLKRTSGSDDSVRRVYRPMLLALDQLWGKSTDLKKCQLALAQDSPLNTEMFQVCWNKLLSTPLSAAPIPRLKSWGDLTATRGQYSHPILISIIDTVRGTQETEELSTNFVQATLDNAPIPKPDGTIGDILLGSALAPYILSQVILRAAAGGNLRLAIDLLKKSSSHNNTTPENRDLLVDAILLGTGMRPRELTQVLNEYTIPITYRIPAPFLLGFAEHAHEDACVDVLERLMPYTNINGPLDITLRRVYSNSDRGSDLVYRLAVMHSIPASTYTYLVKNLTDKIRSLLQSYRADSDSTVAAVKSLRIKLDDIMTGTLVGLAATHPDIVFQCLVMRTAVLDNIAATGPILVQQSKTSADKRVDEKTWLVLFKEFRLGGYPDKCLEVLNRLVKHDQKLGWPMVIQYLNFVAQFYNPHVYYSTLLRVLPEAETITRELGLQDYLGQIPVSTETLMWPISPLISADNIESTGFKPLDGSWLATFYRSVLSTVESPQVALGLFERYLEIMDTYGAVSDSRITDIFVDNVLYNLEDHQRLDHGETIYKRSLERLNLRIASSGWSQNKSLRKLCQQFVLNNEVDRAIKLLIFTSEHPKAVIRGSSLEPWLDFVSPEATKSGLARWAESIGAK